MKLARLGAGKWHVVKVYGDSEAHVACGIMLRPIASAMPSVAMALTYMDGEPTCRHCIGWLVRRDRRRD